MHIEDSFYDYEYGIYNEPNCGSDVNHAMLLYGYGTDPVGGDYWLIKNSWGEFLVKSDANICYNSFQFISGDSWGDWGYVKYARNKNVCNIGHSATVSYCQTYPTAS